MYCAQSSKWGLFGRNTRSAIQGTTSRLSVGEIGEGIREGKEMSILRKRTFLTLGSYRTTVLISDAYGALVVAFGHGVIDNHIVVL